MTTKRILFSLFALSFGVVCSNAALIPAPRLVNWTPGVSVGVPGGIPTNRTHLIDVTKAPYNADNTGNNDCAAAIKSAIAAAASGDVVYLPAGTYNVVGTIDTGLGKSNFTVRGAGESTVIKMSGGGLAAFYFGNSTEENDNSNIFPYPTGGIAITGGMTKDSTVLNVSDTSLFTVGQLIKIRQDYDLTLPVVDVNGNTGRYAQNSRVVSKGSGTITISPALYRTLTPSLNPRINVARYQASGMGIEDMKIDASGSTAPYVIWLDQALDSWVKNVHITLSANYMIFLSNCLNCEVRHSNMDQLAHTGTNGAGLLVQWTGASLFEDNIIYKCFPLLEMNFASTGNVFAYNLWEDSSVYGSVGAGIDTNHGPHCSFNLYEGNIAPNVQADGFFGSCSDDTIFRNWLHGTCPGIAIGREPILLGRFTRNYSIVGNIIGKTGVTFKTIGLSPVTSLFSYGNPNMGNDGHTGTVQLSKGILWANWGTSPGASGYQELDLDVAATVVQLGNWNSLTGGIPAAESLGGQTLPNSLYQTSKPAWFGSLTWPAFDPTNPNQSYDAIPAGYRYKHGTEAPGVGTAQPTQPPANAKIIISVP